MGRKRIRPTDDAGLMFVGLDLHKMYTQYAVMDDDGVVVDEGRMENDPDRLRAFSESLGEAKVVIESSSTWYWVYRILSERHEVILSNPAKTKAIAWAKLKNGNRDNAKTRAALFVTATAQRKLFPELLSLSTDAFNRCLTEPSGFSDVLRKAKMKNVSINFVGAYYDLRRGINYAIGIPHGILSIEEQEYLKDIEEDIEDYAPEVKGNSELKLTSLDRDPEFTFLSVVEWMKYATEGMDPAVRKKVWYEFYPMYSSYDMTFGEFLEEVRNHDVPFSPYYEDEFCKLLRQALCSTCSSLDALIDYLEKIKSKYGAFDWKAL